MSTRPLAPLLSLVLVSGLACRGDDDQPSPSVAAVEPEVVEASEPAPVRDPIEAVHDCATLAERAERVHEDLLLLPVLCPGLLGPRTAALAPADSPEPEVDLDHTRLRTLVLALGSASAAARAIPALDHNPELQGIVRLAALDRSGQAMPSELPDPATALLTPINDRTLAAVELAYALLRKPDLEEKQRTRAHAFLARVYLQAIQSLGLLPGRPLPPLARLLAGPALFHGRNFCRFYWQQRVAGLERSFAETELDLLALLIDLDNTAHAGDPGLLAVERQRTRSYLLRSGPTSRIAKRAQQRPEARALGTELLLPLAHELGRRVDQGFIDQALDEGLRAGAEAGGYGLDPVVALLTEQLRQRDLREYERRLARRVERARKSTPRARLEGKRELEPELPVEWPSAADLAGQARAWLVIAHGRGPDFARQHALGRALLPLRDRPDAVRALLARADDDVIVRDHQPLLLALLDAHDGESLAALRLRVATDDPTDPDAARRSYALAARDSLLHPR